MRPRPASTALRIMLADPGGSPRGCRRLLGGRLPSFARSYLPAFLYGARARAKFRRGRSPSLVYCPNGSINDAANYTAKPRAIDPSPPIESTVSERIVANLYKDRPGFVHRNPHCGDLTV